MLSLIGIYRGEIDFIPYPMKKSNSPIGNQSSFDFKFNHNKLNDKLHLIDVIAIIQDLNIDRGE